MALFDWLRRTVNPAQLKEVIDPVAGATVRRADMHPASGLTPRKLASLLKNSITGDPEQYLALAEEMEERDNHYGGVIGIRKRQVAQLPLTVVDAGDDDQSMKAGDLVREALDACGLKGAKIDILDAVGKGFSCTKIHWDTSEKQWQPNRLQWFDPRGFLFDKSGQFPLLRTDNEPEELAPYEWIYHCSKMKSGEPIRGGLARGVAWSFLFKSFTMKDWAIFCEAYGQPMRIGKYGPNASQKEKDVLLEALRGIGVDFAAMIPESMLIELVQAKVTGSHELYERRGDFLDRQVSKLVLGQTGTTDAIAGGYGVGKTHDNVRQDIERSDADQLEETLDRDLVIPIVSLNMGPQKKYPKIIIGRPDEVDVAKLVTNVAKLMPFGLEASMTELRDKIGLKPPKEGDTLLVYRGKAKDGSEGDEDEEDETDKAAQSAMSRLSDDDGIDKAINAMLEGGDWEPLIGPIIQGLDTELAAATSVDQAKAILNARLESLGVEAFANQLAKAAFAARLSGEVDETI